VVAVVVARAVAGESLSLGEVLATLEAMEQWKGQALSPVIEMNDRELQDPYFEEDLEAHRGETGCVTPDAATYIKKAEDRARRRVS
jgi:hypothetical protein